MFTLKEIAPKVDAQGITYTVELDQEYTVQKFCEAAATVKSWGNITVKHGQQIVDHACYGGGIFPDTAPLRTRVQSANVISVRAVGSLFGAEDRMDYCIYIKWGDEHE